MLAGCGAQDLYEPPESPVRIVGRLSLPSEVEDVAVLGDYAYLAGGQAGLIVVDISDPAHPVMVKMLDTVKYAESVKVASTASTGGVVDIAFVVEGTEGITTYDVTDPDNAYSFEQGTTAVDGTGLFVDIPDDPGEPYIVYLAESWKGLRVFESDAAIPGLLNYNGVFSSTRGYAKAVTVQNGFAYVADDQMGMAVLDVRRLELGAVRVVSACDTPGNALGIGAAGDYFFIADDRNGLVCMECRLEGDPAMPVPTIVGQLALPGDCIDIVVRDNLAFLAAEDGGVHGVDVSVPSAPRFLGSVVTSYANGLALHKSGMVVISDRDEGLIILAGLAPFSDHQPPASIRDLAATGVDSTTIQLTWSASGDDGLQGTAATYDLRHGAAAIASEDDWQAAAQVADLPEPQARGSEETFEVTDLAPGTEYFFALKVADAAGNWSSLSNSPSAVTPTGNVPPTLTAGGVTPDAGTASTDFTFTVTYRDGDGDAPTAAQVVIGGTPYTMSMTGGDYETGATFAYTTTLAEGSYQHYFTFADGHNPAVTTATEDGPWVGRLLFQMGSPASEPGRDTDETLHTVVIIDELEVSPHEVTQAEYEALMGTNPSRVQGATLPVHDVTWFDAVAYANALSVEQGLSPAYQIAGSEVAWLEGTDGWRLPTESEWEAYCRAGTSTAFAGGTLTEEACGIDPVLDALGWYCGNAGGAPQSVESKQPNAWGLYDMHGNVWEWCWDYYTEDLGTTTRIDPRGPGGGAQRVIRGGSWYYFARDCRSASRAPYWPTSADDIVGFRVVRNP